MCLNYARIACEYVISPLSIFALAKKLDVSTADIVAAVFQYLREYPESSWHEKIDRKVKTDLAKLFLQYPGTKYNFLEEYKIKEYSFIRLICSVLDDPDIIKSNAIAETLFCKATDEAPINSSHFPKRIIRRIAWRYVNHDPATQDALANIYGVSRATIAAVLKRGIAENILDDTTASMVFVCVKSHANPNTMKSYLAAFDTRENTKPITI